MCLVSPQSAASAGSCQGPSEFHAAALGQVTLSVVAMVFGISTQEIQSPSRRAPVAFARQTTMYLLHTVFRMNQASVGRALGRDRTTASHACHVVEDARDNPEIDRVIESCEEVLRSLPGPALAQRRELRRARPATVPAIEV